MVNSCQRLKADLEQIERSRHLVAGVSIHLETISRILNLAGNETRLSILYLLHKEGNLCPCDLSDMLEVSVSAISQHLRKMKDKDLIYSRKEGQTIFYSLNPDHSEVLSPTLAILDKKSNLEVV